MSKPTTREPKKPTKPQRYILCIGKWAAMEMAAEIYGFELKEQPEEVTQKLLNRQAGGSAAY